ncbi:MAG: DUF167 domain-containing protein [Phenylobacterium sp.]|nr:MAG: DUF167 domain-containing protein [Phenylobacterium sp.]
MTPRGGRDAVEGWMTDDAGRAVLKLRVSAAAADGAANAAVIVLLAKALKLPKSAIRIAAGETARLKRLEIEGVDADDLARAFGPEPDGPSGR